MSRRDERILLLGGFGRVGLEAARYLLENSELSLLLCGRRARALPEWMSAFGARVESRVLDVEDTAALDAACAASRLVIACVGPSGLIGDRVALACKRVGVPLVDAGGYDPLLHALEADEQRAAARAPLVINVGLLPGLSGMFPQWLIETQARGRAVERLDLAYVGRDAWTYHSAWDIVSSLGGFGEDRGFCYLREQQVVSTPMRRAMYKATFPEPIGAATTMLLYSEEIARLARTHAITEAHVHGANIGPRAALVCMLAKMLGWHASRSGIERGARWLVRASARDMRKLAPAYGIRARLRYRDGASDTALLTLTDTYRATGAVIALTAAALLEQKTPEPGVQLLHEAVPAVPFMARLREQGLVEIGRESAAGAVVAAGEVSA